MNIEPNEGVAREMPRYRSHKEVWALKIKDVQPPNTGSGQFACECTIFPEDPGYAPFLVSPEYMAKHQPQPGGYYVVYKDGYASWSPAAAFEEGYTRI